MPQILTQKVDAVPSNGHFYYKNFQIGRQFSCIHVLSNGHFNYDNFKIERHF